MLENKGTIELETERLILRRVAISDANAMFNNWANDERVTKYVTWKPHGDVELTKSIISDWVSDYNKEDFYQWGIVIKETNEIIGTIGVVKSNEKFRIAEIGYCIGYNYWGKGYVAEAFKKIIDFLFDEVKYHRIEAYYNPSNPNSGKVMEKCGLQYEGLLRKAAFDNEGNYVDLKLYAMLEEDRNK